MQCAATAAVVLSLCHGKHGFVFPAKACVAHGGILVDSHIAPRGLFGTPI